MVDGKWAAALDAPREEAGEARRPLLFYSLRCPYNETPGAANHLADAVEFASVVLLAVVGDEHDGGGGVKAAQQHEEDI